MPKRSAWGGQLNTLLLGSGVLAVAVFVATYYPVAKGMLTGAVATLPNCDAEIWGGVLVNQTIYVPPAQGQVFVVDYKRDNCPVSLTVAGTTYNVTKLNGTTVSADGTVVPKYEWRTPVGATVIQNGVAAPIEHALASFRIPVAYSSQPQTHVGLYVDIKTNVASSTAFELSIGGAKYSLLFGIPPNNAVPSCDLVGLPHWDGAKFFVDPTFGWKATVTVTGGSDCAVYVREYTADTSGFVDGKARLLQADTDYWMKADPSEPFATMLPGVTQNGVAFSAVRFKNGRMEISTNTPPPASGDDGGKRVIHVYRRTMTANGPTFAFVKSYPYEVGVPPPVNPPVGPPANPACAFTNWPPNIVPGGPAVTVQLTRDSNCLAYIQGITAVGQPKTWFKLNGEGFKWRREGDNQGVDEVLLPAGTGYVSFSTSGNQGELVMRANADAVPGTYQNDDGVQIFLHDKSEPVSKHAVVVGNDANPNDPPAANCTLQGMPAQIVRGVDKQNAPVITLQGPDNCLAYVWASEDPAGNNNYDFHSLYKVPFTGRWQKNSDAAVLSEIITYKGVHLEVVPNGNIPSFRIYADADAPVNGRGFDGDRISLGKKMPDQHMEPGFEYAFTVVAAGADNGKNTGGTNVVTVANKGGDLSSGESCLSNEECQSGICQGGICVDDCVYNYGGPTDDPQTDRTFQYVDKADWDRGVWQDCYSTFVEPVGGAESDVYKVTDFQCDRTLGQTCAVVAGHAGDPQCAVCSTVKATGSSPTSSSSSSVTSCSDPGDVCRLSSENLPCADSLQKNPSTCYKGGQLGKCYACGNGTASNGGFSSASSVAKASSGPIQGTCTMFVVHQPGLVTQLLMSFLNTCMTQTQQSCEAALGTYVGQKCAYSSLFPFSGSAVLQTGNCPFTCTLP